jgi:hypothetical protein
MRRRRNVVITPEEFFSNNLISNNSFVLTASVDNINIEMADILISKGFTKGVSFENIQTLSPFYPTIPPPDALCLMLNSLSLSLSLFYRIVESAIRAF